MEEFVIEAKESLIRTKENQHVCCLQRDVRAFYHSDYHGGSNWKIEGKIEYLICTMKNDKARCDESILQDCENELNSILFSDLRQILRETNSQMLPWVVCVVPRAKREDYYRPEQKRFRSTIQNLVNSFSNSEFIDGTQNIIRHTDTMTTHSSRVPGGYRLTGGESPYCGITKETCNISGVMGKNILLIDDVYTKSVGIDEDAIQALYDNGANEVIFYSVGKTYKKI